MGRIETRPRRLPIHWIALLAWVAAMAVHHVPVRVCFGPCSDGDVRTLDTCCTAPDAGCCGCCCAHENPGESGDPADPRGSTDSRAPDCCARTATARRCARRRWRRDA